MSPEGSSIHSDEALFEILENEMAGYKNDHTNSKFIIAGDFNAYTQCV